MTTDAPEPWREEKQEGYYVSITDMLIGLLFLCAGLGAVL